MSSKTQFVATAGSVKVGVNGNVADCPAREFSTGSVGWNFSNKVLVPAAKTTEYLTVQVGDNRVSAAPKHFQSGKKGWYYGGKMVVNGHNVQAGMNLVIIEDGTDNVRVQVGINLTVLKSKEWPASGDPLGIGGPVTDVKPAKQKVAAQTAPSTAVAPPAETPANTYDF